MRSMVVKRVLVGTILVVFAAGVTATYLSQSVSRNLRQKQRIECLNNLQQIESAVRATALEAGYPTGSIIPTERLAECLKDGEIPKCPSGGSYTIPPVGGHPTCSDHGDLLLHEGKLDGGPK